MAVWVSSRGRIGSFLEVVVVDDAGGSGVEVCSGSNLQLRYYSCNCWMLCER